MAIFGGLFLFGSAFALAVVKTDEKTTASDIFDMFILGGIICFFRGLYRGISEGARNRTSDAYPLLIVMGIAVGLLATGFTLMSISAS
jgi:hypothetical protein